MSSLFKSGWLGFQQKLGEWRVPQAPGWKTFTEEADLGFIVLDGAFEGREGFRATEMHGGRNE